jgi:hypothetical protein
MRPVFFYGSVGWPARTRTLHSRGAIAVHAFNAANGMAGSFMGPVERVDAIDAARINRAVHPTQT